MTTTLALALLGTPELRLAGQPLTRFRSAKVYALLYYLAVTRRTQPRTVLAGLFWGDGDEYYARRNLNRTLSDLAQFVDEHLIVERQSLAFARQQPYWLDVEVLEEAMTTTPTAQTITTLAAAADLYRGDFLDGFYVQDAPEFEQWVLTERTRLRSGALTLFHTLAHYHAKQDALSQAIDYARRILALEPWHEEAHRQLMLWLAQSGQRSAALTQYELCRQALQRELHVEPAAATVELVAQIRAGSIDKVTSDKVTSDKVTMNHPVIQSPSHPVTLSPSHLVTPSPSHNLPAQRTPFVGRATELADIMRLLIEEDDCRLLTLVSPGGMGKTRLALRAAEQIVADPTHQQRFADGLFFVPLENVGDENGLVAAVISVISRESGFSLQVDVPPLAQLVQFLRTKSLLLLLDNFEHLIKHAALCSTLLEAAPGLKLLVTSRETLGLLEAWFYPVVGLTLPNEWVATEAQGEYDAVRFFVQCAQRARPGFTLAAERQAVLRICKLVEGMPLGIELATAWLKLMSCEQIAQEVARGLDILTARYQNIPARHHSMRVVMDHSWALLTAAEAGVLARLAVFRGGFHRAAAEQVANATLLTLAALVDKALLRLEVDGRYRIHELLRQYAQEKLTGMTADLSPVLARHGQYYAQFLQALTPAIKGGAQLAATETMAADVDNLRMAWQWAVAQGQFAAIQQSVQAWLAFCHCQSRYQEGATFFGLAATALAALPPTPAQQRTLLTVHIAHSWFLVHLRRFADALAALSHSRTLYQTLGQPPLTDYLCDPALPQGIIAYWQGAYAEVARLGQEALQNSLAAQNPWNRQVAYYLLGRAARGLGEFADALAHNRQALAIATEVGDRWFMSFCHDAIGSLALGQHDYALAHEHYRACLRLRTEAKDAEGIARAQLGLGMVAYDQRDYARARLCLTDALAGLQRVHSLGGMASALNFLGRVAVAELDYTAAKTHFREALQTIRQLDAARSLLPILLSIGGLFCQIGRRQRGLLFITWVIEHPASDPALRSEAQTLLHNHSSLAQNRLGDTARAAEWQPPVEPAQPLSNLTSLIPTLIDELTNLPVPLPDDPTALLSYRPILL